MQMSALVQNRGLFVVLFFDQDDATRLCAGGKEVKVDVQQQLASQGIDYPLDRPLGIYIVNGGSAGQVSGAYNCTEQKFYGLRIVVTAETLKELREKKQSILLPACEKRVLVQFGCVASDEEAQYQVVNAVTRVMLGIALIEEVQAQKEEQARLAEQN